VDSARSQGHRPAGAPEGNHAHAVALAEKSLARTDDGRWTLKFDRESFLGGDGLAVLDTIKEIRIPLMLVRAERSRIMTAEGMEAARVANPQVRVVTIPDAHHHVILEKPDAVARVIEDFAASLF